jgi:hypothetical protein
MRYDSGTPANIEDLDIVPARNNPQSSGTDDICVLLEHIRALSGFVAQLHARVKRLEDRIPDA